MSPEPKQFGEVSGVKGPLYSMGTFTGDIPTIAVWRLEIDTTPFRAGTWPVRTELDTGDGGGVAPRIEGLSLSQ